MTGSIRAVPVARHPDPDRADRVGHDRLGGGAVARVRGPAPRASLVSGTAEVLGHLLVQRGLQHGPGELLQQAVRAGQVESLLLGAADHLQRELPLDRGRARLLAFVWIRRGFLADGRLRCHGFHCLSWHVHHRPFPASLTAGDQNQLHTYRDSPLDPLILRVCGTGAVPAMPVQDWIRSLYVRPGLDLLILRRVLNGLSGLRSGGAWFVVPETGFARFAHGWNWICSIRGIAGAAVICSVYGGSRLRYALCGGRVTCALLRML